MSKVTFRAATIYCLAAWAAVWCLFMLIRLLHVDIRVIPGIGPFMLVTLVVAVLAPLVAIGLAGVALIRQPREVLTWVVLGCAIAAFVGEGLLFAATRWL